jgi:hypothetical protein
MEQGNTLSPEFFKRTAEGNKSFEKKSPRMSLVVTSMVWERKSHGLFDYEGKDVSKSTFSLKRSGLLARNTNRVQFYDHSMSFSDDEENTDDPKLLVYVRQFSDDKYLIQPRNENQPLNNRIWLIVRSLNRNNIQNQYALRPNDVIKIGRVMLRITELNTEFHSPKPLIDEEFDDVAEIKDDTPDPDTA